ncbi:Hypothetical predicted protein [Lecanosticta acicola]|uniref:Uncharacterized protein n=1 Tax=Lecanosticta acicola TaxID=111012 RepID=A0AAI8YTV5_9PEZI|nr:Hypothetical predicted protein [Lecanosticta acicola]
MALQTPTLDEPPRSARMSPRDPYDTREPYRAGDEPRSRNPPPVLDERSHGNGRESIPPPREARREDDLPRAPPTGPSSQRAPATSMAPPTGPAAVTAPSGPRGTAAPPAGPRGAPTPRGDFAPRGRGGFGGDFAARGRGGFGVAPFRGGRGGAPPTGPGFGRGADAGYGRGESYNQDPAFGSRPPPSGPRSSFSQAPPPTLRQNSVTTTVTPTQPRAQRFANGESAVPDAPTGPKAARPPTGPATLAPVNRPHPAIAELPKIVDGGLKAEPLVDRSRLNELEDQAEKLKKQIEERETRKRKSLREWDRMTRETEVAALRSELAEEALRQLNGEAESQAAF